VERLSLRSQLTAAARSGDRPFLVLAELVPLAGHRLENIERFLEACARKKDRLPPGFRLAGITLPQSPNGTASLSPADIHSALERKFLWGDLDVIPHVSAKDHNSEAVRTYLLGLHKLGLETVLAVTGDKPAAGKGVFEVDSVGLIRLIQELNFDAYAEAGGGGFAAARRFFTLAAVSPFKYTEPSQMQQYFKMKKKLRAGAGALITQMGWDWRKSGELFRYLADERIKVPVFGNVFLLSSANASPRLMAEGKLPGCFVSRALFESVSRETPAEAVERAAVQTAMYRDLGAAGVDVGGLPDFETLETILGRAAEIGSSWSERKDLLDYGVPTLPDGRPGFYLYDEAGRRRSPSWPKSSTGKKTFDFFHGALLTPGKGLYPAARAVLGASGTLRQGKGPLVKAFFAGEKAAKTVLFDCQECGDCYLPENFGLCTIGRCEKGLSNAPCGDADPRGRCGTNPDRICVGESIYDAAASEGSGGLRALEGRLNDDRDPKLAGTSSLLNYYFGRDHTRPRPVLYIAELLHGSIPRTAAAMAEVLSLGPGAYDRPGGARDYLIDLIKAQVRHKAAYIDINVDAFGGHDLEFRKGMMADCVRLIRTHGDGVPVCVDSGSEEVLRAGLQAWYEEAPRKTAVPLINAVKTYTMDRLLPLRAQWPFRFIGMLVDEKTAGHEGVYSVDELYAMAREIFTAATGKHGFRPADIYIDSTVFPLAIDMPMAPDTPGYTYRTFETIRRVRRDRAMKGVHISLGITNAVRDLPGRRTGVCRAYLAVAREYGLDAGIVNVLHDYDGRPAAPDLVEFVRAFVRQDGSAAAGQGAIDAMMNFCRVNRRKKAG